MDRYERVKASKAALKSAEADGRVADNMEVRKAIVRRIESGEITLEAGQAELARIKRGAKAAGKVTRAQAYRGA